MYQQRPGVVQGISINMFGGHGQMGIRTHQRNMRSSRHELSSIRA